MTLPLTPEMLEAAYEYLLTTPPFKGWKMPSGEEVVFSISKRPKEAGRYVWDPNTGLHHIIASMRGIAHTESLMKFVAHEMVHLYLKIKGWESKSRSEEVHNAVFRKFAARICKYHGFDPKAFF